MRIKKNDTVVVIAGKDKGKQGKVLRTMPKANKVFVEGLNMQTKHQKQTRTATSEIKHQEGPIDVSNVMLVDPDTKERTRVRYDFDGSNKIRVSKKSGKVIE
jgi:ribosomal protein L24, bacterial/organelle